MRRLSRAHRVTITAPGRRRPPSAEASPSQKCSNQGVETKCLFLLAAILFYTPARRFALFPEARQLFRSSTRPLTSSSAFPGRSRTSGSHCSLKESHFSFLMACCLVNFLISSAKFLNLVSALPIFFYVIYWNWVLPSSIFGGASQISWVFRYCLSHIWIQFVFLIGN